MSRLSLDSKTTLHFLACPLQDLTLPSVERHLHGGIADVAQVEARIDRGCLDAAQPLERLLANQNGFPAGQRLAALLGCERCG